MSGMFTEHQSRILRHRLERAILWGQSETYKKEAAWYLAGVLLDELKLSGFSAAAQRRAIEKVAASLDDATPLRSVSRADRDAQPVADATELGSGVAS